MNENTAIVTCICVFLTIVGTCIITAILQPEAPKDCLDQQRYFVSLCSTNFKGEDIEKCLSKTPTCEKVIQNDKHSSEDVLQGREEEKYGTTP